MVRCNVLIRQQISLKVTAALTLFSIPLKNVVKNRKNKVPVCFSLQL